MRRKERFFSRQKISYVELDPVAQPLAYSVGIREESIDVDLRFPLVGVIQVDLRDGEAPADNS